MKKLFSKQTINKKYGKQFKHGSLETNLYKTKSINVLKTKNSF